MGWVGVLTLQRTYQEQYRDSVRESLEERAKPALRLGPRSHSLRGIVRIFPLCHSRFCRQLTAFGKCLTWTKDFQVSSIP